MSQRERWGSGLGLVLAMAGNAVGLGNFLRFPVQAAQNGGGAFMIPYVIAMVLLAVPLMWLEWAMGRFGGVRGHGTTPFMFQAMWKHPIAKYFGVLGLFIPLCVTIYYTYVESWTMGYAFFSLTGSLHHAAMSTGAGGGGPSTGGMAAFLKDFIAYPEGRLYASYAFFLGTIALNVYVMYNGISKGIERLAKIAMPTLFIFALVLVVRAFTLPPQVPAHPTWTVTNGLGFIWNPDLTKLLDSNVWLAATGQVFFTLSIGFGAIQTYASYLREKDDVALTGLTTAMTNEFAEVILGGSLAIPIAFAFFGPAQTTQIAAGGSFSLGFISLPFIFQHLPGGTLFGTLWFALLFFAGITSSVALTQPAVAFLQDEFKISRHKAVLLVWAFVFVCAQAVVFGTPGGDTPFMDQLDFWAGTFLVVVFALLETVVFGWIFGIENGWNEITKGSSIRVPRIFRYVIKYVTPLFLLILLGVWAYQQAWPTLLAKGVKPSELGWIWGARAMMVVILALLLLLVRAAWKRKEAGPAT